MTPLELTRLGQLATNAGFDRQPTQDGGWLAVRSSHFAESVWLRIGDGTGLSARLQQTIRSRDVRELPGIEATFGASRDEVDSAPLIVVARDESALVGLLDFVAKEALQRRDNPLAIFQSRTRGLPKSTEVEKLTIQRIGQDVFRASLIEFWQGECAVTGCSVLELLRASHIKPWSKCDGDAERLDPMNGLLLSAAWDAAFDSGLVTFSDDGVSIVSARLPVMDRASLGIGEGLRLRKNLGAHRAYLAYHRTRVFRA